MNDEIISTIPVVTRIHQVEGPLRELLALYAENDVEQPHSPFQSTMAERKNVEQT